MKKWLPLFTFLGINGFAQLLNPGFELKRDTLPSLPVQWQANLKPQFTWQIDTAIFFSGKHSLSISNSLNSDSMVFSLFSQTCPIQVNSVKKVELSAFIKTKGVSKNVGLWCQLLNKDKKQTGFYSLETKRILIKGTTEWTKYSITLLVDSNIKHLLFGGFLKGTGQVWYDDFNIEDMTGMPSSKIAIGYIDQALKIAEKGSIVSDSINWKKTRDELYAMSAGAQTTKDCYPALNYLITVLRKKGDNHSGFYPAEFNQKHETQNMNGQQPVCKYLGESIGYIEVPGFESVNDKICKDFAEGIQRQIQQMDTTYSIHYWVVDLRNNTGGNMYPMIAGLGPIIENGTLGYFTSPKLKVTYSWEYKNGSSKANGHKLCTVEKPYTLKHKPKKIAVLVGPNTASSGEMTAISFIGKDNAILVGLPTAGYSTGNAGHKLSDGSVLNLCESFCTDRHKNPILGSVKPHEIIKEDNILEYAKSKILE